MPQRLDSNQEITDLWTNYVYVSYSAEWEGNPIQDHFLWPKSNHSLRDMKMFAVDFLSDILVKDLKNYECH